jgi:hypothetical protein
MMGGHMQTMIDQNFYGLKTYAERDNVPVIFVALRDTPTVLLGVEVITKIISSLPICLNCLKIN